jgi:hypothetical protein
MTTIISTNYSTENVDSKNKLYNVTLRRCYQTIVYPFSINEHHSYHYITLELNSEQLSVLKKRLNGFTNKDLKFIKNIPNPFMSQRLHISSWKPYSYSLKNKSKNLKFKNVDKTEFKNVDKTEFKNVDKTESIRLDSNPLSNDDFKLIEQIQQLILLYYKNEEDNRTKCIECGNLYCDGECIQCSWCGFNNCNGDCRTCDDYDCEYDYEYV